MGCNVMMDRGGNQAAAIRIGGSERFVQPGQDKEKDADSGCLETRMEWKKG